MTRETKIGLLVGLGFIVVFAILLSHTGSLPPSGDHATALMVDRERSGYPTFEGSPPPGHSSDTPAMGPLASATDAAADGVRLPEAPTDLEVVEVSEPLPRPPGVGPQPVGEVVTVSTDELSEPERATGATPRLVDVHRVAPPLAEPFPDPRPTPRPDPPSKSSEPESSPRSAPLKSAPPKPYLVKRGDTMSSIAVAHYNTAKPAVLNLLVEANKDRVKDVNSVIEGQQLFIPDLPPEMFEAAPSFDVTLVRSDARTVSMDDLPTRADGQTRRAPKPADSVRTGDHPAGGRPELATTGGHDSDSEAVPAGQDKVRWHEVKQGETYSSIAKEQLGSAQRWQEIKKLNPDVDPMKMRPGERIKLPPRSQSRSTAANRVSV